MSGLVDGVPYVTASDPVASYPITSEALAHAVAARATKAEVGGAGVPLGSIVAYGGAVAPEGWHLCDGSEHGSDPLTAVIGSTTTPDLRARFIVGAGAGADGLSNYAVGSRAGSESVALTAAQSGMPAHGHTASSAQEAQAHTHSTPQLTSNAETQEHTHSVSAQTSDLDPGHVHPYSRSSTVGTGGGSAAGSATNVADGQTKFSEAKHAHTIPAHNTLGRSASHTHTIPASTTGSGAKHNHAITVDDAAGLSASAPHENRPPYYALTYIIRKA